MYRLIKDFAGFQKGEIVKQLYEDNNTLFGTHAVRDPKIHIDIIKLHPEIFDNSYYLDLESELLKRLDASKEQILDLFNIWFIDSYTKFPKEETYNQLVLAFQRFKEKN